MTKIKILGWIMALPLVWLSCEENTLIQSERRAANLELLTGSWTDPQYNDSLITYTRVSHLKDNEYGFTFSQDSIFMERKNIGWCGTPPVTYGDYEGTWSAGDSVVNINVAYWGGTMDYKWKIISLNPDHLTVYTLAVEYHPEPGNY